MKKVVSLLLVLVLALGLVGCGQGGNNAADNSNAGGEGAGDEEIKVALFVSATGELNDNAFHSAAWAGITSICDEKGIPYTYYKPAENAHVL